MYAHNMTKPTRTWLPGETCASWAMEGLLDFICGSTGRAKILRNSFVFKGLLVLHVVILWEKEFFKRRESDEPSHHTTHVYETGIW